MPGNKIADGSAATKSGPSTLGIVPASRNAPKPSITWRGVQTVPSRSSIDGAVTGEETANRSSISTNKTENGKLDHSALAVTWNKTTCP